MVGLVPIMQERKSVNGVPDFLVDDVLILTAYFTCCYAVELSVDSSFDEKWSSAAPEELFFEINFPELEIHCGRA